MTERHPDEQLLLDLALGEVDGMQRDLLTGHLALCEPCRSEYGAIADSVDHALAAAPRVAPPAGFSRSALAAMGMTSDEAEDSLTPDHPDRVQRGRNQPRMLVTALAAVVALLLGVAVGATLMKAREHPVASVAADGPALLTHDGSRVGTVLDTRYEGQPVLAVTLTGGRVGVRYECQLVLADGSRQPAGSWVLRQPSGTTWLLDRPDGTVTGLELVTEAGRTWATATL
jgi:hypothetical protein